MLFTFRLSGRWQPRPPNLAQSLLALGSAVDSGPPFRRSARVNPNTDPRNGCPVRLPSDAVLSSHGLGSRSVKVSFGSGGVAVRLAVLVRLGLIDRNTGSGLQEC